MHEGLLPDQRQQVIYHAKLPPIHKSVALYLATHAINKDSVWPSVATIAERTGWNIRTVKRSLKWLQFHGYIKLLRRRKKQDGTDSSNEYLIHFEKFIANYEQRLSTHPAGLDSETPKREKLF